jgi:hypothetical protein
MSSGVSLVAIERCDIRDRDAQQESYMSICKETFSEFAFDKIQHVPLSSKIPVGMPGLNESDDRIFLIWFEGSRSMRRTHPCFRFIMNFSNIGSLNIKDGPRGFVRIMWFHIPVGQNRGGKQLIGFENRMGRNLPTSALPGYLGP